MLRLFPNICLFLGFGARTLNSGIQQASSPCEAQNKNQLAVTALNKNKAESIAFARLSAEFRIFAGSDRNAQGLVIGLRDGTSITLTPPCINGSASSASFTPPTGRMGYSNVSIALSVARQQLSEQGISHPTPHQLQAALVGGTITSLLSGKTINLPGILQLKAQGMGWGKIASLLGIKLGSVIGEARPAPAVLKPRTNAYTSLVKRTMQIQNSTAKATTLLDISQHIPAKPGQDPLRKTYNI